MKEYVILFIILLLSYDTTLFFQSLLSQPIFSCQLIGLLAGDYELGLAIGAVSQILFLSYAPVGGARIPDVQVGPNLIVLLAASQNYSVELAGKLLPLVMVLSIIYLYVTSVERHLATLYMKYVKYEDIRFFKMLQMSFISHFVLFGLPLVLLYEVGQLHFISYIEWATFDGTRFFYFMLLFSLGSLSVKLYKRGFKHQ